MNYSAVGIANMALQRIGARGSIASLTENSPNAVKVNTVWDMIFQEVLSERDWKFAKLRVQLPQAAITPVYAYQYAYTLPSDFLRLTKIKDKPHNTEHRWQGSSAQFRRDLPVWPDCVHPWVVETVASGSGDSLTFNKYLLTNYNSAFSATSEQISINYIRLISDMTQLMPGFVNALANRLASELSIAITEDKQKAQGFMEEYRNTLNSAQAQLECDDYLQDESGSNSWVLAGRRSYWRGW